jgi:hypothetical protein
VNARITVAGFMIFILASIAWMIDGWLESKASLVIQNVILLINALGVLALASQGGKGSERLTISLTKPVTTQASLVNRNGRLRAFRNGYSHKEDVTRHVARNIYAGNATFFRVGINYDAPFRITFAAEAFG